MLSKINFFKVLLLAFALATFEQQFAQANPANGKSLISDKNAEEINDLNAPAKQLNSLSNSTQETNIQKSSEFLHHDEDKQRLAINLDMEDSLKYDVEILEAGDIKKESLQIEERFRGPSILLADQTYFEENIEVNAGGFEKTHERNILLTVVLVIFVLISIGLYAALVMWRAYLEKRYGMRELLVTTDDDFAVHINPSNNNNNNIYNNTVSSTYSSNNNSNYNRHDINYRQIVA